MINRIIFLSICLMGITSLFSQNLPVADGRYFDAGEVPESPVKTLTLSAANSVAASNSLNAEINRLGNRGGVIVISNGGGTRKRNVYLRDIVMKSNVHIKVNPNVTIRPYQARRGVKVVIFDFGAKGGSIRDVALTSTNEDNAKFKVVIPGGAAERIRLANCIAVRNFKISDINITDSNTIGSNVELNLKGDGVNNTRRKGVDFPYKGLVQNIISKTNNTGYGIIQIRAGMNIKFENLDGQGGVTLRIESGFSAGINSVAKTIDDILGRNITVRNGDAAVQLSPHQVNQGHVDVRGIRAIGSTWAVQLDGGFIDRKPATGSARGNEGIFSSTSIIRDIREVRPSTNTAQIKKKDFKFIACNFALPLQRRFDRNRRGTNDRTPDGTSTLGRSIGIVRDAATARNNCTGGARKGCFNVRLTLPPASALKGPNRNILQANVVYTNRDGAEKCKQASRRLLDDSVIALEGISVEQSISLYPNPADTVLNVRTTEEVNFIKVYNALGQVVKEIENKQEAIDITDLEAGIYFVDLHVYEKGTFMKKLIVN